jgi:hypothetical protein
MYNTKYECRYHLDNIFLDTDSVNDDEKQYIRDLLYREDLLNIFCVTEYSDDAINKSIQDLYKHVVENNDIKECSLQLAARYLNQDIEFGLMILFSYDYMNLSHICISEFLEIGIINEENIRKLKSAIFRIEM